MGRSPTPGRASWSASVCLTVKTVGKPDAGNPHVRFDERGRETGRCFGMSTRALPRLYEAFFAERHPRNTQHAHYYLCDPGHP